MGWVSLLTLAAGGENHVTQHADAQSASQKIKPAPAREDGGNHE